MNMKRKAKKFAKILELMVSGAVLTSCGKEATNEVTSVYEIDDSGIIVFGHAENCTDVYDEKKVKVTNELLEKIKEKVEEYDSSTLHIELDQTTIDFTNIDLSNVTSLIIDCSNINFNYIPFYDNAYQSVSIVISEKTNKEDIINFLQNVNFIAREYDETKTSPSLNIEFTANVSVDLINEYLEVISKIGGLYSIYIETSSNINELHFENAKSNVLEIFHKSSQYIDYDITLNDKISEFNLETHYDEEFDEKEVLLKNLKINSNNKELIIDYKVSKSPSYEDFFARVHDDTIIMLPNNSAFELINVNVDNVSTSWYQQFKNTSITAIRNLENKYESYFYYNSSEGNIDDAITDMNFETLEEEAKTILSKNGININISGYNLFFDVSSNSNIVLTDDRVYEYINALIRREKINKIGCGLLNKEIDFKRINLDNIEWADTSNVGYDFDYTALSSIVDRRELTNINIYVKKNTNHINKVAFLQNFDFQDNCNLEFNIEDEVNVETIYSYLNAIDLSKVQTLYLTYSHIDEMDLSSLNVPALYLNNPYNNSRIDYEISINEEVKEVLLNFECDVPVTETVISNITINSSNNDLRTYIYTTNKSFAKNCSVDDNSVIKVPNNSKLCVIGIKEMSITDSFLEQFNDLDTFIISDNGGNYEYNYKKNRTDWEYNSTKDSEQRLLKELN